MINKIRIKRCFYSIVILTLLINSTNSKNGETNERNVTGKVVIVTGAAQGIGFAISDNFLKNGAKLVILLDVKKKKGEMVTNLLKYKYGKNRAEFIECDVSKDLDRIYSMIIKKYKCIDVLVNNAAIANEHKPKKIMFTNAISTIEWSLKWLQHMRRDKHGKGGAIINLSSMAACNIDPIYGTYRATKLAILGFSLSEGHLYNYKKTGVRIIAMCPGPTNTSLAYEGYYLYNKDLIERIAEYFNYIFQTTDDVGSGAVVLFKTADSGTSWDVKDGEPPVKSKNTLNIFPFDDIYAGRKSVGKGDRRFVKYS